MRKVKTKVCIFISKILTNSYLSHCSDAVPFRSETIAQREAIAKRCHFFLSQRIEESNEIVRAANPAFSLG